MARARAEIPCPREPIGLSREEAARFIGVSSTTFDRLVEVGDMPPARKLRGRLVWHAGEVETAFLRLPVAGESPPPYPDDEAWGRVEA